MFVVPKTAGGHPRLVIAIVAVVVLAASVFAAIQTSRPGAEAAITAHGAAPPRPPVQVVEDLPLLAAEMARHPRFMGGILVARGDTVLFRQVYGLADVDTGQPLSLTSRFRLASVSKQFTAAAVLRLQDQGKLNVTDPVCRWIQPCPTAWQPVRIEHLLSHTSGIPDLMARPGWGTRRVTPATLDQLTEDSTRFGLSFAPGTKVAYDNAGFNLAAAIVERASGMAFADYLKVTFFGPLGMDDTGLGDADGVVAGHAQFPRGLTAQREPNVSIVMGAGALYSTLDDQLAWQRALHHGHVVSAPAYAAMIADHSPADTKPERGRPHRFWGFGLFDKALGLQVVPAFAERQIYHTGSWSGFRNLVTYQPEADVTVIVLSNDYHQRDQVFLISQQAVAEALGRPFPTGLDR